MMTLKTAAIVLGIKLILVINKDDEGIKTEDSGKYIDQDDDDDDDDDDCSDCIGN